LRHFINADNNINETIVAYEYLTNIEELSSEDALHQYFSTKMDVTLPSIFNEKINLNLNNIKHDSLFEMTEEIIGLFELGNKQTDSIYLQAFQDTVFDFISNNNADIDNFLKWWDTNGCKKTISTPEGQDAIRIITIHKSKGLDFEAVIIPFCDWDLDQKAGNILWCEPKHAPYNELEIIPIPYTQKLKDTIFYEDYIEEKMHAYIDNLNIAYVAFTRARSEMIAFAPQPTKEDSFNSIGSLMSFCFNNASNYSLVASGGEPIINLSEKWEKENRLFCSGAFDFLPETKKGKDKEETKLRSYLSQSSNNRLSLRLHSTDYFGEGESKINYGTIMHELLNKIELSTDVEKAIIDMMQSGIISEDESLVIKTEIEEFLASPTVKEWFSDKYKILNETSIITPNGQIYRPDRVLIEGKNAIVIDYKFGEKEEKKYVKQVENYKQLIEQMGYNTVGYICYIKLKKMTEIN
jgi:ATP-dependent exoDNAse (exonuclease V) beta subunit